MENNNQANGKLLKTNAEFDISDSAFACVMFILLNIAFSFFLVLTGIKVKMSSFAYFVLHAAVEGLFGVAVLLVAKIKRKKLVEATGMNNKVNGAIVGWCLLVAFLSLLGFGNLTNVFIEFLEYFGFSSAGASLEINNFWQYLGSIITSCIMAGFCEELLFRGVIQSGFKKWGIKVAVGFSALIFMLMHGSALQTVHQFVIGVVIGYIFYKTNNFWIGTLIHFFNNLIPITQVYLLSLNPDTASEVAAEVATTETVSLGSIFMDLIMAIIVAWAGYYFISMIFKKIIKINDKLNGKDASKETLTSIKVDGDEQKIEMSIEEVPVIECEVKQEEKPKISAGTIVMFTISGLYLVLEWILNTISMF